ncbi:TetR/AcrR family transcriptional regulator [Mycobacteroides franklinii]|uniref:TetR/AcrR family transcriptional regulator n=1 Tax=Mycobacteroides franklinii TaxID=948102 RepID=A0A4R5PCZ7_9MYCO|nr:TetR-like C-terminal domain-containing protein [Mycobacteroides franklinii]ORA60553.1 TetR family transcriptional regulator [Mycobacteroides franklinii]TDH22280.1 TetR/AcrR family transcriptional regulator [Mycobacteroides franklinii]
MTESSAAHGSVRPGGRTERTRRQVHDAVRSLFAEGRDTVSVREVSERSGIHEVTIYRRWGNVESVILDVAVTQLNEESPFPNTGNLRDDLLTWAMAVSAQVKSKEGFAFYRALAMARSALFGNEESAAAGNAAAYLKTRTDQIQAAIDGSVARGENPPTVEQIFDAVLAPIYLRAVFGYVPPDQDLEQLVDRVLVGSI